MDLASIGFRADTSGIHKAQKGLDDLSKQGNKTDRALSGAGASIGKSFAGIAAAVGGLVSASAAMQKLIEVSREFDVLNAGLITATGSADKAAQAFKAIEDFATTTPYSLAQATKAFTQLVNMGLTPSEAALTSYGNTAAAMGKDLSMMVEAVADATVGEFERLKEFGIKSRAEGDNVSFTFRGVTTTVKKSAEEIEGYLIGLGQNEFAGAMANRMNTLDGAISNLSDSWDGLFRTISSQGAGDLITSGVRMATDAISGLTDMIASGQLGGYLDAIGAKFNGWGADIASVLDFVGQLFADAGEFWYLDMGQSANLIIDAFKNIPENIRAFIQIATVELSAFVDGVAVYAKAIGSYLDITEEAVNIEAEFARISSARASSIESIMGQRDAALQSFNSQTTAADGLRAKYDELNGSVDKSVERLAQYKVVVDKSAQSTAGLVKELSKLDDAALDYFDALEELDQIEKDRISRKEEAIDAMLEPFEEGQKAVEQYTTLSEKAAERIESAFADVWVNAFDGFESVVDGMKNAFKRMLAEMAHMALTKPIMVSLGMGGMLPGAAGASTGAGGLSSGLGMLGGLGGGLISAGGAIGGAFGGGLAGAGGLLANGSIGAMFSGAGSLFGSGNIMAGLGMSMPIIAAAVVAALGINKLTGGGLFGTSFKTDSQSLGLSLGGGDISGGITTEESRKKSLFRGTKRRTTTSDFDASAIDDAFDQISAAIGSAANAFGIVGADEIIKGFAASVNINIKDKTEAEIQSAIEQWVSSTTDGLVSAVFGNSLDGLQKEGEGVIDTVNRLSMNMGAVRSITKALGIDFDLTGKAAMVASTNIVELAGGIDQLAALSTQYYQSFYSETERQSLLTEQLTAEFAKLNIALPTSRDGFRAIVDGIDLTTESGQKLFASLMQLVPGLDRQLSAAEALTNASKQAAEAAIKEAEAKAAAIKAQGLDMQLRLYDALGQSVESLALRRQMELEATDESLRAMLMQIYAAQDAATAQNELASAQSAAADSARNAAAAARDMVQSAFNKLQEAAQVEKDRLATDLELKLSAIDKERDALTAQRDSVIAGYREQGQAVNAYVQKLEGLSGVINDFLGQTGAAEDPFKRLGQIFNEVKAGLLPEQGDLQAALSGVSSAGAGGFGSQADASFALAVARNQASEIGKLIGGKASGARSQVQLIEQQIVDAEKYFTDEMTKLDNAEALAQKLHDEQVGKIDAQLSEAQKQLNALLGVDDRILTMSEAAAEFYAALAAANGMSLTVEAAQVEAINRVEAAVIGLGVTIAEAVTPAPPPMDKPFAFEGVPNVGEPVTREMVELLKELVAASDATAKHTKTTANVLELNQYEAQEAAI